MEQEQIQKDEAGKIAKKHEEYMRKFTAILGGESMLKPDKALPEEVRAAIEELAKDRKKEAIEKVKASAKELIEDKIANDREFKKLEKEFQKKKEEYFKKWNEKAENLFKMIDQIGLIEKEYYSALKGASEGKIPEDKLDD